MTDSICIEDFCGRDSVGPTSFSADYFPGEGLTYLTGDWDTAQPIPPMPCKRRPTLKAVYKWAQRHGSGWNSPE